MRRTIRLSTAARDVLDSLHVFVRRTITAHIKQIALESAPGKELTDDLEGFRSTKVGKYRVIFNLLTEGMLWVDFVGHRRNVYQDARLLLDRQRGTVRGDSHP